MGIIQDTEMKDCWWGKTKQNTTTSILKKCGIGPESLTQNRCQFT